MRRADIEVPNRAVDMNSWARLACYPRSTFYPLSDGPSTRNRRITKPHFRACSTCKSRSQAPFYLCARCAISKRAEGTFGHLRYFFGGDRPSQTTHQAMSLNRIHGSRLEFQNNKGGISRMAPCRLASTIQRLPPILHVMHQNPLPGYSKGSRGLTVLLQITGICTGIEISLSPSLRQRPDRYAIDAGRNLPDKEFRYLRTVIVTAAVYWGFSSELLPRTE